MKKKLLAGIAVLLLAFLYYYIELPAINIHESGFWFFLVAVIGIIVVCLCNFGKDFMEQFN